MRFKVFNQAFEISWIGLGVYVLLMTLLCNLGFWQLSRAEQKKQLLEQQQVAQDAASIDINQQPISEIEAVRYQKATLSGRFDTEHQFLLDNQIVAGKNGYFVFTPMLIDGQNNAVMVNRGWVALGKDRQLLPNIEFEQSKTQITGRLNQFPSVGLKLKGAEIPTDTWPSVVQVIDTTVLSKKLGYELLDYQFELEPSAPNGYTREWSISTPIPPEKHLAYAVQWFGLALTLTALFIWIIIRKRSGHTA